jgi:hypothetical protein
MRLILWFLLRRFVPQLNIDILDPREYLKGRLISHLLSFIRPSNWLFLTLILLFGAVYIGEIVFILCGMIYNMFVTIGHQLASRPARIHLISLTPEAVFLWLISLLFTVLSALTHLLGIVQQIAKPIATWRGRAMSEGGFNFSSISWMLLASSILLHIGTYTIE